jgi:hypothetical protein
MSKKKAVMAKKKTPCKVSPVNQNPNRESSTRSRDHGTLTLATPPPFVGAREIGLKGSLSLFLARLGQSSHFLFSSV